MAQDEMALNCRVRIDKKVHPSLYQELESLGRRDRCERLRSLAQQGLLAEALGVDVVAAAAGGGAPRQKRSRRKSGHAAAQQNSPPQQASQDFDSQSMVPGEQSSHNGEGKGAGSTVPESAVESAQGASRNDVRRSEEGSRERAEPLRSSSQRLMGMAGMLSPQDGAEDPEE